MAKKLGSFITGGRTIAKRNKAKAKAAARAAKNSVG